MAEQIRDKGCPKALCLKRPTDAVNFLESSGLFSSLPSCFLCFYSVFLTAPVGLYYNLELLQAKVLEYWSPAPLPKGDPGKDAAAPAELRQQVQEEIEFSSDSSVGSESVVEITGASGPLSSAASRR
jgi:hypothetical protein